MICTIVPVKTSTVIKITPPNWNEDSKGIKELGSLSAVDIYFIFRKIGRFYLMTSDVLRSIIAL